MPDEKPTIDQFYPYYGYIKSKCKTGQYNLFLHRHLGDSLVLLGLKNAFEEKYKKPIHYLIQKSQKVLPWMYHIENYTLVDFDLLKNSSVDIKCSAYELDKHIENLCERLFPAVPQLDMPFIAAPATWIRRTSGWKNFVDGWAKMLGLSADKILPPIRYPEISDELKTKLNKIDNVSNIVLFAPEAQTFNWTNVRIWDDLADQLIEEGHTIIANITTEGNFIPRTHTLEMSVSDVIALGYHCHSVYSLRSGLCDCLSGKQNKLFVYYTSDIGINYFSLNSCYQLNVPVNEIQIPPTNSINESTVDPTFFHPTRCLTWLPRKLRGGLRCCREHGWRYTVKHLLQKMQ